MVFFSLLFFFALITAKPVSLSSSNFDELVLNGGKNAFVKFFAPWCGHCKRMAPDWDKLGGIFAGSSVVIGDVDCTVEEQLCQKHGVSGYPTVKYFVDGKANDYEGPRDLTSLKSFTEENLAKACDVMNLVYCSEKEKAYIQTAKANPEKIKPQLDRLRGMQKSRVAPSLRLWMVQRINILSQLEKTEL
eukprot:TRINITY_DN1520_c0_g1_i2.p1 TRINITY_DN1520_c0_g1~~TRINITY_DN1520_c0_g1_i2.p1  ORF type:complete len:189 (+),score=30.84 TRINITY_DN1520_c0_g1_i2:69-635(+)